MKYLLCFLLALLASCHGDKQCCTLIDIDFDIYVENSAGENLLASATPNAINPENLRLEFRINGGNQQVYNVGQDCPRNICYISESGEERLRIFPNETESEAYPITYLFWSAADVDTIRCHFIRENDNSYVACDKIWYNEVLVYPDSVNLNSVRGFKIVK